MEAIPSRKRATLLLVAGGYANAALSIVQGLLLIPLYLHYLGPTIYGYWLASGGMLAMLALTNFGVVSMLIQRVAQAYGRQDRQLATDYFLNGTFVYLGICLLYVMLAWIISEFLSDILSIHGDQSILVQGCFQVAMFAMAMGIFNEVPRSFAQALLRPVFTLVSLVICRLLGIVVTVVLLIKGYGLWAIPVGAVVAEGTVLLLNTFDIVRLLHMLGGHFSLRVDIIKEYLRTSPALFMARLGSTAAHESEPLLITMFLGPEVTTLYMVTRKAADMLYQLMNQIVGSSMGTFSHLASEGSKQKTAHIAKLLFGIVFFLGFIGLSIYVVANQDFVRLWVGDEYVVDGWMSILLGVGFFLLILRSMLWQLLFGMGDFVWTSVIVLCEGFGRTLCAVILLSWVGVLGVPVALITGCALSTGLLAYRIRRFLPLSVSSGSMIRILFSLITAALACFAIGQWGIHVTSWEMFAGQLLLYTLIIVSVFLMFHWSDAVRIFKQRFRVEEASG